MQKNKSKALRRKGLWKTARQENIFEEIRRDVVRSGESTKKRVSFVDMLSNFLYTLSCSVQIVTESDVASFWSCRDMGTANPPPPPQLQWIDAGLEWWVQLVEQWADRNSLLQL